MDKSVIASQYRFYEVHIGTYILWQSEEWTRLNHHYTQSSSERWFDSLKILFSLQEYLSTIHAWRLWAEIASGMHWSLFNCFDCHLKWNTSSVAFYWFTSEYCGLDSTDEPIAEVRACVHRPLHRPSLNRIDFHPVEGVRLTRCKRFFFLVHFNIRIHHMTNFFAWLICVWTESSVQWSEADAVILRTTWDYHRILPEFLAWARKWDFAIILNPLIRCRLWKGGAYIRTPTRVVK
jgi:hypothetical protein